MPSVGLILVGLFCSCCCVGIVCERVRRLEGLDGRGAVCVVCGYAFCALWCFVLCMVVYMGVCVGTVRGCGLLIGRLWCLCSLVGVLGVTLCRGMCWWSM